MRIERSDADIEIDRLYHLMVVAETEASRRLWAKRWRLAWQARDAGRRALRLCRRPALRVLR